MIQGQNPVQVILPMWIMNVLQIQLSVLKVQWAMQAAPGVPHYLAVKF